MITDNVQSRVEEGNTQDEEYVAIEKNIEIQEKKIASMEQEVHVLSPLLEREEDIITTDKSLLSVEEGHHKVERWAATETNIVAEEEKISSTEQDIDIDNPLIENKESSLIMDRRSFLHVEEGHHQEERYIETDDKFIDQEAKIVNTEQNFSQISPLIDNKTPTLQEERWVAMENKFNAQEVKIASVEQYISSIIPLIDKKEGSAMASKLTISTECSDVLQYKFDEDIYALMFCSTPCSFYWFFCVVVFLFQLVLIAIVLFDQFFDASFANLRNDKVTLDLPDSVPTTIYIGQFLAILAMMLCQTDVFEALKTIMVLFHLKEDEWLEFTHVDSQQKCRFGTIMFPYLCKFLGSSLVLFSSSIIVITSDNIIDLFKDFAALQVISFVDNVAFMLAKNGFLGNKLAAKTKRTIDLEIVDNNATTCCSLPIHSFIAILFFAGILTGWLYVVYAQIFGIFFANTYPNCDIPNEQIHRIGDGKCDGGIFNSVQCALDGGDCLSFNIAYPNCDISQPERVGDGVCNEELNRVECDYDGTDCCPYADDDPLLGDGICHGMI